MKDEPVNKILLAAVIILAIGEGYLMYGMSQLQRPPLASSETNSLSGILPPSPLPSSGTTPVTPISPSNILSPVPGIVQSVSDSRLVLANGSSTTTIVIDSSTTFVAQAGPKDSVQYNAEMEVFRQSSMALSQDPKKNTAVLEILIAPSHFKEVPAHISDIKVGAYVNTFAFVQNGELHANKVIVGLSTKR